MAIFSSQLYQEDIDRMLKTGMSEHAARTRAQSDMSKYYVEPENYTSVSPKQQQIVQQQIDQKAQMASAGSQAEREQIYAQNLEQRKANTLASLKTNPNVSQEYLQVYEQYANPMTGKLEGVPQDVMQRVQQAEWALLPEDKRRNYEAEMGFINQYGQPQQSEEAMYYQSVYNPQQLAGLIETGQINASVFSPEYLSQIGLTPDRLQHLVNEGYLDPNFLSLMQQTAGQGMNASEQLANTQKPTNELMDILSEALNEKTNFKNQKLGVSDLFGMAGLGGYSVLAQSLGQRANEMAQLSKSAANVISASGGAMANVYNEIASNYDRIRDDYMKQMDRLMAIDDQARDYEQALNKMYMQHQLNMEMEEFKYTLKAKQDAMDAKAYNNITDTLYGDISGTPNLAGINIEDKGIKDALSKIFGVGKIGDWCGVFASTISTAGQVGNSWAEKRQRITHQDNPQMGDKLLIPIGVKTDKGDGPGEYGHVAVVLGYDKATNTVTVVESNRDGRQNKNENNKGIITLGQYSLDQLNTSYGRDWGFMKGSLKKDYLNPLLETLPTQLKGAVQIATGDVVKGAVNMGKGLTTGFLEALSSIKGSGAQTSQLSAVERYEKATGEKVDSKVLKELEKEYLAGTLNNYLINIEEKAKKKALEEAEKNMTDEQKAERAKNELAERAKKEIDAGNKGPEEVYKTLLEVYDDKEAIEIMKKIGYKLQTTKGSGLNKAEQVVLGALPPPLNLVNAAFIHIAKSGEKKEWVKI